MAYYEEYDNYEQVESEFDEYEDDFLDNYESYDSEEESEDLDVSDFDANDELFADIVKNDTMKIKVANTDYDFFEIMDKYHTGTEFEREKAMEDAINALVGIIHLIMRQHYVTYMKNHYEDLLSEGKLGIIKGLKNYDPERSKPSTFFYPYIMHEMQSFIDSNVNKTTAHYSANIRKINKAIADLNKRGIPYDEVMIASITNLTMETVRQSLAMRNYRDEINFDKHTEAFINNNTKTKSILSPEETIVEDEKNKVIHETIDRVLNEYEKKILDYTFGLNDTKTISHKEMAKRLNLPIDKIKKYYASALRKLRESELNVMHNDYLKEDENFTLENEVPLLPIQAAKNSAELLDGVDIDF